MAKTERPMMAPVHPGEMLKEDFLDPLVSASTGWRRPSASLPGASTRSSTRSRRISV